MKIAKKLLAYLVLALIALSLTARAKAWADKTLKL